MNSKAMVPLVVALCLGTVAAFVGRNMIARGRQRGEATVGMTRAVVAATELTPGAVIREADISVRDVPSVGLPPGLAFSDARDVVGRVVSTQVVKEQIVLATLLAPKNAGGGLQALVPVGMRAVTLEVNEVSGLAGLLTPGARVDVVQTIGAGGEVSASKVARSIVENVRVLAVGRRTAVAAPVPGAGSESDSGLAKSVTLLATAEQAHALDLASTLGVPRLVLRNGTDERLTGGTGVTLSELLGNGAARPTGSVDMVNALVGLIRNSAAATRPVTPERQEVVAARPRYREVEVIRGGASTSVRVNERGTGGGGGETDVVGGGEQFDRVVPPER
jgi:pilus assembly protein CpaB